MKRIQIDEQALRAFYETHTYVETLKKFSIGGGVLDRRIKEWGLKHDRSTCREAMNLVSEEDIRKYYILENHTKFETRVHFNLTEWALSQLFKKFNIVKPVQKVVRKRDTTKEVRYGNKNYNNRNKYKETYTERYGGVGFGSKEVKAKAEKTTEELYGNAQIRRTEYYKEKSKQTKLQKYGSENYVNLEKAKKTCLERYGVECYLISQDCYSKFKNDSKPNQAFATLLDNVKIQYEREYPIKNRCYDFKVGSTLIEINPSSTHNSTWGIKDSEPKDSKYHYEKTQLAKENGYRCIHVWDWDDRGKILMMLQPRIPLYARKLRLKEIPQSEANRFLKQYHMQNGSRGQEVCLGLYQDVELIEVMTFGKPRFNKNFEWELIRLCTKPGVYVIGGAERLMKHFKDLKNPKSLISYCDCSKFSGEVYSRLGFVLQSPGFPSKHWYSCKTGMHVTDNGLRMQGFDRLFGEQYGKYGKGTSNEELMREHGFVEIWDAGQAVYTWNS